MTNSENTEREVDHLVEEAKQVMPWWSDLALASMEAERLARREDKVEAERFFRAGSSA